MRKVQMKLPGSQQGSFYSTVIIVIMFGLFLTTALKITPAYLDNNIIVNAMEGVAANNELADMSVNEVRSALMRTLNTNNVKLDAQSITIVRIGNQEFVDINYETTVPLFYNISALVSFSNRFEKL